MCDFYSRRITVSKQSPLSSNQPLDSSPSHHPSIRCPMNHHRHYCQFVCGFLANFPPPPSPLRFCGIRVPVTAPTQTICSIIKSPHHVPPTTSSKTHIAATLSVTCLSSNSSVSPLPRPTSCKNIFYSPLLPPQAQMERQTINPPLSLIHNRSSSILDPRTRVCAP